jgi:hypothetical protein
MDAADDQDDERAVGIAGLLGNDRPSTYRLTEHYVAIDDHVASRASVEARRLLTRNQGSRAMRTVAEVAPSRDER